MDVAPLHWLAFTTPASLYAARAAYYLLCRPSSSTTGTAAPSASSSGKGSSIAEARGLLKRRLRRGLRNCSPRRRLRLWCPSLTRTAPLVVDYELAVAQAGARRPDRGAGRLLPPSCHSRRGP